MKNKKIIPLLLIIIILLIGNTFAWFIFNENVNITMKTKIKNWNIEFIDNTQEVTENVDFEIESIYPGMEDAEKTIIVKNNGDIAAEIEYRIKKIKVLDKEMMVGENCTEEEIMAYMDSLPFNIKVELDKTLIEQQMGVANLKILFTWPFEDTSDNNVITEKDQIDTDLGQKAYEYNKLNENINDYNFSMQIQLIAKQKNT